MNQTLATTDKNFVPDLASYDYFVLFFSAGKDSTSAYLRLLELGVPPSRIEIHHHEVDGEDETFFDWNYTRSYIEAFGREFNSPVYFSGKQGGFKRELLRKNQKTAGVYYDTPDGDRVYKGGDNGHPRTRLRFPQQSGDLQIRWCSSSLKIEVGKALIRGQERFKKARTLVITGERASESPKRSTYTPFKPHCSDTARRFPKGKTQRHVDHWHAVFYWSLEDIWNIIERWGVVPPPSYFLGFGRKSCLACIFGGNNQWASLYVLTPELVLEVASLERQFHSTISNEVVWVFPRKLRPQLFLWLRKALPNRDDLQAYLYLALQIERRRLTALERAMVGTPYPMNEEDIDRALSTTWSGPIRIDPKDWILPLGATGDQSGPS